VPRVIRQHRRAIADMVGETEKIGGSAVVQVYPHRHVVPRDTEKSCCTRACFWHSIRDRKHGTLAPGPAVVTSNGVQVPGVSA
jgi:hypothetical protein